MRKEWYTAQEALTFLSDKLKRSVSQDELITQILKKHLHLYLFPTSTLRIGEQFPNRPDPFEEELTPFDPGYIKPSYLEFTEHALDVDASSYALIDCKVRASRLDGQAWKARPTFADQEISLQGVGSVWLPSGAAPNLTEHFAWKFAATDLKSLAGGSDDKKVSDDSLELLAYELAMFLTEGSRTYRKSNGADELKHTVLAGHLLENRPKLRGLSQSNIEKALRAGRDRSADLSKDI